MGWAKFDDQFTDHPKVVAAGPWAELLAMRAIIHCARYETDGHVQAAQLPRLALGIPAVKKRVEALVTAGLWVEDDDGDGWWVHDFLDYHPSRADQERERGKARERMAKVRAKKARTSGERSPDVRANTPANIGRSSGNPDPTRPQGQELDGGAGAPHDWPRVHGDTPLTDRIVAWARSHGHVRQVETRADITRWCLDLAADHLGDTPRFTGAAVQLVVEWVERMCGEPLAPPATKHLVRVLNAEGPRLTFTAMETAVTSGAGLSEGYADDPQALVRYARSCIARWRAEGQGRIA